MTEEEWLASSDTHAMRAFVRFDGSDRQFRLYACACGRRVWRWLVDIRSVVAVETAERFADGMASSEELAAARLRARKRGDELTTYRNGERCLDDSAAHAAVVAQESANRIGWDAALCCENYSEHAFSLEEADQGLPPDERYCPDKAAKERSQHASLLRDIFGNPFRGISLDPSWLTPAVVSLAHAAYDERILPSGYLDPVRLAVLADALEEVGAGVEVVGHLRSASPHVRGCHLVDAVLGKG